MLSWALVDELVQRSYRAGWDDAQDEMLARGRLIVTNHIFALYEALGAEIDRAQAREQVA